MNGQFTSEALKLDFDSITILLSFVSKELTLTFESEDASVN
mgnify:FL=1